MNQPIATPIRTAHSNRDFSKFRSPFRRLPLSKTRKTGESAKFVGQDGPMNQHRTSSSLLNSLRRNYAERGLSRRVVRPTCPEDGKIVADVTPMHGIAPTCDDSTNGSRLLNIKNARRTVALLKFGPSSSDDNDDGTDDDTVTSDSDSDCDVSASTCQLPDRAYSIRFDSYVKVVEIPNRFMYTPSQRRRIWNGNKAIRENARRNRTEYEWEGSDWQSVIEEDEFLVVNGEKVHPVHAIDN